MMLRDILTSRPILIGIVFFLLIVGGSLIYTWHVERDIKEEMRTRTSRQQGEPPPENRSSTEMTQTTQQRDTAENERSVSEKQETPEDVSSEGQAHTAPALESEPPLGETEIADLQEKISAEEEKATEALAAEEARLLELKKQFNARLEQLNALIASEGEGIGPTSPPEVRQQHNQLVQEILALEQK